MATVRTLAGSQAFALSLTKSFSGVSLCHRGYLEPGVPSVFCTQDSDGPHVSELLSPQVSERKGLNSHYTDWKTEVQRGNMHKVQFGLRPDSRDGVCIWDHIVFISTLR